MKPLQCSKKMQCATARQAGPHADRPTVTCSQEPCPSGEATKHEHLISS